MFEYMTVQDAAKLWEISERRIQKLCEENRIEGDWLEWDYSIINSAGQNVASVTKELWNWTDTYVIDVSNPQDAIYALMLVLAIDAEKCSRRD